MTKTEFLNDLIYDMAGYLDTSGVDRLKNAVAYRLKGFQLTSDETLPATDVRDNEWILGRYHVDLIAVGRKEYCRNVREEIEQWKDINKNGCNDPFWSDGCNMNLTRNHIIYAQEQIRKICKENNIPFPEECYLSVPPKADINYMAHLKQKERVEWIFHCGGLPVKMKYEYEEQQLSLF